MVFYETTFTDYPNAEDIAILVFFSGCSHHCPMCQNPELQKLHAVFSKKKNEEIIATITKMCKNNNTNKIVLSGGDCLHECNLPTTKYILQKLSNKYDFMIYTGYSIAEVINKGVVGYKYIKCGKYNHNNRQTVEKTDEYIQFVNATQNLYNHLGEQISTNGRYYFKQ